MWPNCVNKKSAALLVIFLLLAGCSTLSASKGESVIQSASSLPETTPWDLVALSNAPKFEWLDKESEVWSLQYQGEPFKGGDTEVFAYYANPDTLAHRAASGKTYPAVVLVHGGGGSAFKEWAQLWAERGYAAIAMDLAGNGLDQKRLPNGGPDQGDDTKFGAIDAPLTDQWPYHAVADVILGHSLIRSFAEVDASRTAVTGISWGGYLTCIVAGLDNRFKAAVPVYGCGFLNEHSAWLPRLAQMTPDQQDKWVRLWDPSRYVGSASMPVFFVNGTNDFAYWLESYAKTYDLVKGVKNFCITVNMPHSHPDGWAPKEIGLFIDQYLNGGVALPVLSPLHVSNGEVSCTVKTQTKLSSANLNYTTDTAASPDRKWVSVPATIEGATVHAPALPSAARICFVTVSVERGAVVSSELVFLAK